MCLGCTTMCGVRVRVDRKSGRVLRVAGNPYHPLSAEPHLPYATPVADALVALSRFEGRGLDHRATACGRGSAALEQLTNPQRVLTPLKRVGPRNGGVWQPITLEQLVAEVVEGGDLFGEGHVDGLRALRSLDPIDPDAARAGSQGEPGRHDVVASTRAGAASPAVSCSRPMAASTCRPRRLLRRQLSRRLRRRVRRHQTDAACAAGHCQRRVRHVLRHRAGQCRQPVQAHGLGSRRRRAAADLLDYVVIDPVLGQSDNIAARHAVALGADPARPPTRALAMAMISWILDNNRFNADFLAVPAPPPPPPPARPASPTRRIW